MTARPAYLCTGCLEVLEVGEPDPGDDLFTCPNSDCGRSLWHRFDPSHDPKLRIGTTDVPDLESAVYVVDHCRLLENGAEVLIGPHEALCVMAETLNRDPPALPELADRVHDLIHELSFQGTYIPGTLMIASRTLASWRLPISLPAKGV
jgi:hypothetical protein